MWHKTASRFRCARQFSWIFNEISVLMQWKWRDVDIGKLGIWVVVFETNRWYPFSPMLASSFSLSNSMIWKCSRKSWRNRFSYFFPPLSLYTGIRLMDVARSARTRICGKCDRISVLHVPKNGNIRVRDWYRCNGRDIRSEHKTTISLQRVSNATSFIREMRRKNYCHENTAPDWKEGKKQCQIPPFCWLP